MYVETDHQPCVNHVQTPFLKHQVAYRGCLKIQPKCEVQKGTNMFLSDTLSRAYLSDVNASRFEHSLEEVDQAMTLAIPESQ